MLILITSTDGRQQYLCTKHGSTLAEPSPALVEYQDYVMLVADLPKDPEVFICGGDDSPCVAYRLYDDPSNSGRIVCYNHIFELPGSVTAALLPIREDITVMSWWKHFEET